MQGERPPQCNLQRLPQREAPELLGSSPCCFDSPGALGAFRFLLLPRKAQMTGTLSQQVRCDYCHGGHKPVDGDKHRIPVIPDDLTPPGMQDPEAGCGPGGSSQCHRRQ